MKRACFLTILPFIKTFWNSQFITRGIMQSCSVHRANDTADSRNKKKKPPRVVFFKPIRNQKVSHGFYS